MEVALSPQQDQPPDVQYLLTRALKHVPLTSREREITAEVVEVLDAIPRDDEACPPEGPPAELSNIMRLTRGVRDVVTVFVVGTPVYVVITALGRGSTIREMAVWACIYLLVQLQDIPPGTLHTVLQRPMEPEIAAVRFGIEGGGGLTVVNSLDSKTGRADALRLLRPYLTPPSAIGSAAVSSAGEDVEPPRRLAH